MAATERFFIGLATSLSVTLFLLLAQRFRRRIWSRPVRRFWSGFRSDPVIMTTEYKLAAPLREHHDDDERDKTIEFVTERDVAYYASSGFFVSYGMWMGVSQLKYYLEQTLKSLVTVIGDKGHTSPGEGRSLVVVGSQVNNRYLAKFLLTDYAQRYPLLREFAWDLTRKGVRLTLPDGRQLVPDVDEYETGIDYAFVACVSSGRDGRARVILISGCNMWGSQAGVQFLLDRDKIRQLPKRHGKYNDGLAFLVRTRISNGHIDLIELQEKRDGSYFYDLRPSRKP